MGELSHPQYRWLERGSGEPVVLLHGLMGQAHHWDDVLEVLAPSCRAIAPTLPILDPALTEVSVAGLARHVVGLLDALAIECAVIGGNSLGGHIALTVALGYPDRVAGLVLAGSSGLFERSFTRGVPHRPTTDYVREKMKEVVYDPSLVTPGWVESVRCTVTTPATALRVVRFARAAKRDNIEGRLGEIAVPTLLVWGADDRITPPEVAERFQSLIADSKLVFLTQCGHAPMLEQPQSFGRLVRAWLEETPLRRGPRPARLALVR